MRDALLNVLINAGQSGQQEGTVRVAVRLNGGYVEIAVEDRGSGIAERHLPHVFDAFYTTRREGNGLGLAIVQQVVAAHQGQVWAENRRGGGARIIVRLPLQTKGVPRWWNKLKKISPA